MAYTTPETPGRLVSVINVLEGYRKDLVQSNTLRGQDPAPWHTYTRKLLRQKGNWLQQWLRTRILTAEMKEDKIFLDAVKDLESAIEPWDANISTMAPDYVESLFFRCPFSSYEHCERLRKNAREDFAPSAVPYVDSS